MQELIIEQESKIYNMGKLLNGIFGPVTGRVGNLSSYVLNGQNIVRGRRHPRTTSTIEQLNNEMRMSVINEFFFSMKNFLKVGFSIAASGTTSNYYNLATGYNKKNAIKGYYPDIAMDFANVLLSDGDLLPAEGANVNRVTDGIEFTWEAAGDYWDYGSDQVMVLAYFPANKKTYYQCYGNKRSTGKELLPLPIDLMNKTAETYISFIAGDRKRVAKSTYLGQV